ncbi:MAG: exo-alpha-sialidase [Victivallaceae bacterium]|nr:exo-alpha-sialidase [Victivallaceae bacterium]
MRSNDNGRTWTQPLTLVNTSGDDRHPVITELSDGTLVCGFFVVDNWYGYDAPPPGRNKNSRAFSIRSTDGGNTWSKPLELPSPFKYYDRMCSDLVLLPNGSLLFPTYGMDKWEKPTDMGLYRSDDGAKSWYFVSRLKSSIKEIDEPAICLAEDNTLVMISRPDGEVAFSKDEGVTWTKPQSFGVKIVAPNLIKLKNGLLVCIFGWNETGGIQIMWSEDNAYTWTVPAADRGFKIDDITYCYANGCELPDGSIYIVYYDPQGTQIRTAIMAIRVKIREDRCGIDILPVDTKVESKKEDISNDTLDVDAL